MATFEEVPTHLQTHKSATEEKQEATQTEAAAGSEVPAELVTTQAPQQNEVDDTVPRLAGTAIGAGLGAKLSGMVGGGYGAKAAIDFLKNKPEPELTKLSGMQRYLNPLLEPLGVANTHYIPLEKFAEEMGLPKGGLVGPKEIQAAVREAQGSPLQRIATETPRGKIYKTIPAKEARDLTHLIEPIPTVEQAAKAAKTAAPVAQDASTVAKMKAALQNTGRAITPTGVMGKVVNTAMPVLSMAGAGTEAVDAYNRFSHGDYGRGIVSSLGALGSAASMIPHPVTRAVGTGAALAAPAINAAIDYFMPPKYAGGGGVKTVDHTPAAFNPIKPDLLHYSIKASNTVKGFADGGVAAEHPLKKHIRNTNMAINPIDEKYMKGMAARVGYGTDVGANGAFNAGISGDAIRSSFPGAAPVTRANLGGVDMSYSPSPAHTFTAGYQTQAPASMPTYGQNTAASMPMTQADMMGSQMAGGMPVMAKNRFNVGYRYNFADGGLAALSCDCDK